MKEKLISEIIREMLPLLDNKQLRILKNTLETYFFDISIKVSQDVNTEKEELDYLEIFLSAKKLKDVQKRH